MSANPIISMSSYAAARHFETPGFITSDPDRGELFDFLIALQTSMDVQQLLEMFSLRLQADYAHRGVRFESIWSDVVLSPKNFAFGQTGGHCKRMLLHAGGHELGWLEIFSDEAPNRNQQRVLDRLLGCLMHPLHNAIRFQRLENQALQDDLTGVGNRTALDKALTREIARAERRDDAGALALMVLDLDGFKALNDEHGHLAGDASLRRFARVLQKHLRDSDQLFRYGGDEFVIILPDADEISARDIARRLEERIAEDHTGIRLRASSGVAEWRPGMGARQLFAAADNAMYERKRRRKAG